MNELIQLITKGFEIGGVPVPVCYLRYEGHNEPYITYAQVDAGESYSGDDELLGYVEYYDFDIYAKGNYSRIVNRLKRILSENGFTWQPSRSRRATYETDTGLYHITLCFAIFKNLEVEQDGEDWC